MKVGSWLLGPFVSSPLVMEPLVLRRTLVGKKGREGMAVMFFQEGSESSLQEREQRKERQGGQLGVTRWDAGQHSLRWGVPAPQWPSLFFLWLSDHTWCVPCF
jgi:hypothetical protein